MFAADPQSSSKLCKPRCDRWWQGPAWWQVMTVISLFLYLSSSIYLSVRWSVSNQVQQAVFIHPLYQASSNQASKLFLQVKSKSSQAHIIIIISLPPENNFSLPPPSRWWYSLLSVCLAGVLYVLGGLCWVQPNYIPFHYFWVVMCSLFRRLFHACSTSSFSFVCLEDGTCS